MSTELLPALDADTWRQTLAGLRGPTVSKTTSGQFREAAEQLVYVLAICYNRDELDPKKLWDRIATAVATACAKVDDADLDRLVSLALEAVRADHARVAANDEVTTIVADICEREETWRTGFVRYLQQHTYAAIIHGRRAWETRKELLHNAQD